MAPRLLTTLEMARFVTDGFLRFDAVVPPEINKNALAEMRELLGADRSEPHALLPRSGTPLSECYPGTSIGSMLAVPEVAGAIQSLVGHDPAFDHHAIHFNPAGGKGIQGLHMDAVIDTTDPTFDIQLFWFPHDVPAGAGGTRFVPGTHLRRVHENAVARYQHLAGEQFFEGVAGTVLIFHQGLWHAGQPNPSDRDRWMFKIRLNPTEPQVRLWDTSDYDDLTDPSDHMFATTVDGATVANELRRIQAWSFTGESRLEQMERARLWRYLSGDDTMDSDWYLTRIERRARLLQPDGEASR